jgi:hypothetical protein
MTGVLASPPARPVDVRVAESPLVGIRFHLDARLADLSQVLEEVERERTRNIDERARLRDRLRRNEEARRDLLHSLPRQSLLAVRRCLREGIDVAAELGRVEERLLGLTRLRSSLIVEGNYLRELIVRLAAATGKADVELDGRASRFSRATRRVFQLVDEQHDAVEHALVEGPLQRLTEAVLDAEVAAREPAGRQVAAREQVERCRIATAGARDDFEKLIKSWRPLHEGRTLLAAIRDLVAELTPPGSGRLRIIGSERRLPFPTELAAYRIAEEALANAARHGGASRADVVLAFQADRLVVVVKDDGDGFDVVATEARLGRGRGVGLIAMRSRAEICGGQFDVRSVIGAGTEVRATFPASRLS